MKLKYKGTGKNKVVQFTQGNRIIAVSKRNEEALNLAKNTGFRFELEQDGDKWGFSAYYGEGKLLSGVKKHDFMNHARMDMTLVLSVFLKTGDIKVS